jgi:SAM-dependent methyltransferase
MSLSRPEEIYSNSNDFYTKEESKRYNGNTGMKNTQEKLTKIALELINFNKNKKHKILDIGCGTGFSLDLLVNSYNQDKKDLLGIDPSKNMLFFTNLKNYNTKNIGFEDLEDLLKDYKNHFDIVLSISALNWIIANKKELEIKNIIKTIAKNINLLLKNNGICIIQFYPLTLDSLDYVKSSFLRSGFNVKEYVYNKDSNKKRKFFLVCSKIQNIY